MFKFQSDFPLFKAPRLICKKLELKPSVEVASAKPLSRTEVIHAAKEHLDEIDQQVTKKLIDEAKKCMEGSKDQVIQCLKKIEAGSNWRERNIAIATALGFDVEGKSVAYVQAIIEGVQRYVFEKLDVHDRRAKPDGKCGDYTTLALDILYGIDFDINPSTLKNSGELQAVLFMKKTGQKLDHEMINPENFPKDALEAWDKYHEACLAAGIDPKRIEADQGKFGNVWLTLDRESMSGVSFDNWVDAMAMSPLTNDQIKALSIGGQVLAKRELIHGKVESEEVFEENEEKVYAAYLNLLGPERMNRKSFSTFKDALMPITDLSRINDPDYLLGSLYILVHKGEMTRESWKKTLTDDERRRSVGNGQIEAFNS